MSDPQDMHDEELPAQALKTNKADGQSPGEMLRAARAAHNYSVADLCAQTMLSPKTIAALENNEFASLSQPVFARGYYRKCAKVLDMDGDALMAAYGDWAGEPAARAAPPTAANVVPQDVTPPRWRVFGLISLIIVFLVALFAIYLVLPNDTPPRDPDAGADGPITIQPSSGAPAGTGAAGAPDDDTSVGLVSPFTTSTPEPVEPAEEEANAEASEGSATLQMNGLTADDAPAIQPAEADPAADAGDTEPAAAPEPAVAPNVLTLEFDQRSWVDVRDATDARLLTGIVEAGTTRTLDAQPPYSVVLGYAPGVNVRIGGDTVDISSEIIDDNTARLTIAAGSATQ